MRYRMTVAVAMAALALAACAHVPARQDAARAAFDSEIAAITTELLQESPETATYFGVDAATAGGPYLGRLSDYGPEGRAQTRAFVAETVDRLEAIDPTPLDDQRRLTRSVLIELLEAGADADAAAGGWGEPGVAGFTPYPVTQLSGVYIDLPNLMQAQQPVTTAAEAEAYLERLAGFAAAFDETLEAIGNDAAAGVIPPDFIIEKTLAVIDRFTAPPPDENVLYTAFAQKLEAADVPGAAGYLDDARTEIAEVVYPAYARLDTAFEQLLPLAEHHAGIDGQPNGAALYEALIRVNGDTELSADEIHALGLAEVERITAEMDAILRAHGYEQGSVGERMDALAREPRFLYPNTDEGKARLIADLNAHVAKVQSLTPMWFGTIPPQPVEVRRVPSFSEESAPGGYYDLPSLDGSRPGVYWINLRDTANNPSFSLPTLTHHEAAPGHHYQIALSLELEDLPLLRKIFGVTNAYVEGWALYAELVAKEMGLYEDDPFGDLGRLQSELFRAVRLVVDTGIHAKGWSREQAIAYMVDAGAATPSDAEVEIERYAAWPGQALGYKMGMLKILELRARAEAALGDRFDIRAFHDAVLLDGGLPLPVLEERVDAWIAAEGGEGP